jgi:hypothetical protein
MSTMTIPGFTAEASLYGRARLFGGGAKGSGKSTATPSGTVVPAIPFCGNCPDILDMCAETGGRPRAVCRACAIGDCFSGVENPIEPPGGWPRGPGRWPW